MFWAKLVLMIRVLLISILKILVKKLKKITEIHTTVMSILFSFMLCHDLRTKLFFYFLINVVITVINQTLLLNTNLGQHW